MTGPTSGIYALIDPRTGRRFYIGKSEHIEKRLEQHLRPWSKRSLELDAVLGEIKGAGFQPVLEVLEVVPDFLSRVPYNYIDIAERNWIAKEVLAGGKLVNRARGGAGAARCPELGIALDELNDALCAMDRAHDFLFTLCNRLAKVLPYKATAKLHRSIENLASARFQVREHWYRKFGEEAPPKDEEPTE